MTDSHGPDVQEDTDLDLDVLSDTTVVSRRALFRGTPISPSIVAGLIAMSDIFWTLVAGHFLYLLYVGWSIESYQGYLAVMVINATMMLATFYFSNLYAFEAVTRAAWQIPRILVFVGIIFLIMVGLGFALKISADFSRVWAFGTFALGTVLVVTSRIAIDLIMRRLAGAGRLTRNLAIIGAGEQARRLIERIDAEAEPWIRIVGLFDDRIERVEKSVAGHPVRGTLDDLLNVARAHRIDDVVVALPWNADDRLTDIVGRLLELPVHVRLGSDLVGFHYAQRSFSRVGGVPVLDIASKPIAGWKAVAKGIEDKVLSFGLLVALAPLLSLIALAIKLDSRGPVFFLQKRYGFNNQVFHVIKFRSMYHSNEPAKDVRPASRGDSRVSRVGRVLRRTGLDELPQLLNVLGGTMSLVGPRPLAVEHNEQFAPIVAGYFARHRVKPGITGWAQVNGFRSNTHTPETMAERVEYDLYYINNWSLPFDLQILAMTTATAVTDRNAY